jgi:hypothetical protein
MLRRGLYGWLHTHKRDIGKRFAQMLQRCSGCRIASDDNDLRILVQQEASDGFGKIAYLLHRARTVGDMSLVTEVDN